MFFFNLRGLVCPLAYLLDRFSDVFVITHLIWVNQRFANLAHDRIRLFEEFSTFLGRKCLLFKNIH